MLSVVLLRTQKIGRVRKQMDLKQVRMVMLHAPL